MRIKPSCAVEAALASSPGLLFGVYVVVEIVLAGGGTPPIPPDQAPVVLHGGHVLNNHIVTTKSWSFDYDHARALARRHERQRRRRAQRHRLSQGKTVPADLGQTRPAQLQSLDFTAVGKVHIERIDDPERRAFDTDLVTWTNDAKMLRMPHPSYVHSGSQRSRIDGITVNFDDNTIHLGKVSGGVIVGH